MARNKKMTSLLLGLAAVLGSVPALGAAEWPKLSAEGARVWDTGAQWPDLTRAEKHAPVTDPWRMSEPAAAPIAEPASVPAFDRSTREPAPAAGDGASRKPAWDLEQRWPSSSAAAEEPTGAIGSPKWPAFALEPQGSPFGIEVGARYWYSKARTIFQFSNDEQYFGHPTSTIDWNDTRGNSGELFFRFDHRPTGLFVKGLLGGGKLNGGDMIDRDFFTYQWMFSNTSSEVHGDSLTYGMIDFGWSFDLPQVGLRLGAFAGYHYWHEKMTAYGLLCNVDEWGGDFCGAPGTLLRNSSVAVMQYEPTWNAVRLGFDAHYQITPAWSIHADVAAVPWASVENKDSHLLRQGMSDLGPAPNIISRSSHGYGLEADLFVDYAITPNFSIGAGARYWGLLTTGGKVMFGPTFQSNFWLDRFDQQRYGLLVQAKARF